jgi:hypothetical protein
VRGKLTRTIGAGSLVLALASAGLACGSSDHAPTQRGEASTQSRPQSEGRRTAVWRKAVPAAYLRALASRAAGQRGTRLSMHWLGRDGSVTDTDPRGTAVAWPAPMRVSTAPTAAFRIAMPERPDRVDIRTFGGGVDAQGVPRERPQLIACSQRAPERNCRFALRNRGVDVELLKQTVRPITRFVLYARWYVPFAQRPPRARSNPSVSASWGFVAVRGQSGRR